MNHTATTERAATPCTTADPELFFSERPEDVQQAIALCRTCPVMSTCLQDALDRGEPCGVWGSAYLSGGMIADPPTRVTGSAGLPGDPPAGVDTVTLAELADMLDRTSNRVLKMLRMARDVRAAGDATGLELPEPIAGGSGGYPFRWRRDQATAYATRNPRQRVRAA